MGDGSSGMTGWNGGETKGNEEDTRMIFEVMDKEKSRLVHTDV